MSTDYCSNEPIFMSVWNLGLSDEEFAFSAAVKTVTMRGDPLVVRRRCAVHVLAFLKPPAAAAPAFLSRILQQADPGTADLQNGSRR
ncbi:hypothetical protein R1flu_019136 [Riccia fluitans]|uniref:Uncharacterized protein n=1 Tax=Riccia fluitans TaxID=41844 RepID=A0ABD1ZHU7_9MARC